MKILKDIGWLFLAVSIISSVVIFLVFLEVKAEHFIAMVVK